MIMAEKKTGQIYTVSKLTREIKSLLEKTYPFVWVTGEISNYAVPASGHSYFSLKDPQAIINAVMFKNQKRNLKFNPENGMKINGLARLTLYEPRGAYQLIFEHLEPEGAGSMQVAFEQLKRKLSEKGFFDDKHKKQIPFLPSTISVITSGTGAAVRDIINVAKRRFSNCRLDIFPVKVQGDGSENDICEAINRVNQLQRSDLILLARGGGSLEDLAAFNSESVATAIFHSDIPVVTGVGHETDFTIADFVADLRAPTPSAAAELALPDKINLVQTVSTLQEHLNTAINKKLRADRQMIVQMISRLKSPETIVYDFRFRLEDYESRLINMMRRSLQYKKAELHWLSERLLSQQPANRVADYKRQVKTLSTALNHHFQYKIQQTKTHHRELSSQLQALNPAAVLSRGYSISRFVSDKRVITRSGDVKKNDQIEIILSKGRLITRVEKTNDEEKII
jgi:exodeoxyribonuclease VII large subunit